MVTELLIIITKLCVAIAWSRIEDHYTIDRNNSNMYLAT